MAKKRFGELVIELHRKAARPGVPEGKRVTPEVIEQALATQVQEGGASARSW